MFLFILFLWSSRFEVSRLEKAFKSPVRLASAFDKPSSNWLLLTTVFLPPLWLLPLERLVTGRGLFETLELAFLIGDFDFERV